MLAYIFATLREAGPFIQKLQPNNLNTLKTHRFTEITIKNIKRVISLCGIGIESARKNIQAIREQYPITEVLNIGICGTVKDELPINSLYTVSETFYWPDKEKGVYKSNLKLFKNLKEVKLATCKEPIFNTELRKKISKYGDIVDMEGAAIAQKCEEYAISYSFLKGVSDKADVGHKKILYQNIDKLAQKMADKAIETLNL